MVMKNRHLPFVFACIFFATGICTAAVADNAAGGDSKPEGAIMKKEIITPDTVAKPAAPYASVVKVTAPGSLVFLSGVVSCDIDGNIIYKGDIFEQTKQTVKNLILTLEAAGVKPENVVKTTTYVAGSAMKDFFETKAFLECLTPFDATDTLIGVASFAGSEQGQLIEIDAIAVTE
jgi:enamine deaminase RidA (YjgF/YER057c/UK114 family)